MNYALFDAVELTQATTLAEGQVIPAGAKGAVVEVLDQGAAYLVELFGAWVKENQQGHWIQAQAADTEAFQKTLGVVLVAPEQLRLHRQAYQTVGEHARLYAVAEELPAHLVREVADFAEFLQQKMMQQVADHDRTNKVHA